MRYFLMLLLVILGILPGWTQNGWILKKDKNGIKVYSRPNPRSKFDELRVETTLKAKLSDLAAVLLDVPDYPQWSFNVRSSRILREISPSDIYFYTEIDAPWPADDRDLPIHLRITQDPLSKTMTVAVICIPDLIPPRKNMVRVPLSKETWTVTRLDASTIHIDYQLEVDPGADPPGWLINMFSVKGPYETFDRLRDQIQLPKYRRAILPFINN